MRKLVLGSAFVGMIALAGGLYAQSTRTVWDGVYTEEQAAKGAAEYSQNCSACHGVSLGGTGEAPTLSGGEFIGNYNGLTLGDLFDRIRTTMPFDRPGGLTREQYAQITAHLLKFNGFPAGQTPMPERSEMLATIGVSSQKPGGAAGGK